MLIASAANLGAGASSAIAANSADLNPAATAAPNGWTGAANALNGSDDGVVATTAANNADQGYASFGISLPAGSIIDGITVKVEAASSDPSGCQIGVSLSGNQGSTLTTRETVGLTDVSQLLTFGGVADPWGHVWDASELSNTNFRVVLRNLDPGQSCTNGSTTSVDRLSVIVTYRTITAGTSNATLTSDVCDSADFNFIIDMSGSIGPQGSVPSNLQQLKDGITGFVDAFQAAGGDGRYSATRFSGSSATTLTSGYITAATFTPKIDALSGPSGLTPTATGIDTGAANNGADRAGVPNVMFVVTDGSPNKPNSHGDDLTNPDTWLSAANAAVTSANAARAGSGASKYVVKAVYLSTAGDPGDTALPFSNAGDAAWAQAVMSDIGGGSFLDADFKSFAGDLLAALHCAPPPPTIAVTKTASPTTIGEPGGTVTFSVDVHNLALDPVTLDSLVDDVYGNLDGKGTCATGGSIAGGGDYTCHFDGAVAGAPGTTHKDTVTADASNKDGKASASDDATVTITDVLPTIVVTKSANPTSILEPGGTITFTVTVHNTSPESVSLDSLVDDIYGNLDGQGTCASGGTIAAGATYSCHFDGAVSGNAGSTHKDTVTATASDNEQNHVQASDSAIVTIGDVLPAITVVKTANPTAVDEPGGNVTFSVAVHNTATEAVQLTSLVDDVYGDLNGVGTCATGGTIAAGATYACQFVEAVAGNAGDVHHDTVTAGASDDDGNSTTAHDDATVTVRDVKPTIDVVKTAFPITIGEPGGMVTFSVRVDNLSVEPVTLDTLVDDVYGNLDGLGTCSTGATIAVGGHYDCQFDGLVSGNAGTVHVDTVTATGSDDEGSHASAEDSATVDVTDVLPTISVDKTAQPGSLPAGGGSATFQVVVTNHSVESVTITSLVDDVYGNLDGRGTCAIGAVLAVDGSYTCSFVGVIPATAGDHVDVVTAVAVDDEQNQATDSDDAIVTVAGPTPTPSPTGGVKGATGTPRITPPPTDVDPATVRPSDAGLPALLLGLFAIGLVILLVTPRRAPARARNRRR